jgi:hypothetical protein
MRHRTDGCEGKENLVLRYSTFCGGSCLGRYVRRTTLEKILELAYVCSLPLEPMVLADPNAENAPATPVTSYFIL